MALTEFGKAVRKARIEINETLLSMANALGTTDAYLSGMETGRKKISDSWVTKIQTFFKKKGVEISNLQELANVANEMVPVKGLSLQQQMLVAGFASSPFTPEQLKKFASLLEDINKPQE